MPDLPVAFCRDGVKRSGWRSLWFHGQTDLELPDLVCHTPPDWSDQDRDRQESGVEFVVRAAVISPACVVWLLLCLASGGGCASIMPSAPPSSNPVFVRANDGEFVWERTVDVVHDYLFEIRRENKLDGVIETEYKTGSGVLEPWHRDSVGVYERTESTLQSIRRKAYVSITPAEGGYLIGVEAYKELEDVANAANSAGAATFLDNSPLQRDLSLVVGQATPSGWISRGRDSLLEQAMIDDLRAAFGQ